MYIGGSTPSFPDPSILSSSSDMLMGLKEGQEKMSKSDPDSAIFMEDTEADVKRKIKQVRTWGER